jgi:hypothetical protein
MNQTPSPLPTLQHSPNNSQHHDPLDRLTDTRRRINHPQVLSLNQSSPQMTLHVLANSLSHRTLPDSMLPFAVPSWRGPQKHPSPLLHGVISGHTCPFYAGRSWQISWDHGMRCMQPPRCPCSRTQLGPSP